RRHLPVLHAVFGEAMATLTAIALFARAFELLAPWPALVEEAARVVGSDGMIGGQAADLSGTAADRLRKTSPLIRFAVTAPARLASASADVLSAVEEFGELLGQAYQMRDDLLDALATEARTGKTAQQDLRHHRSVLAPGEVPLHLYQKLRGAVARAIAIARQHFPQRPAAGELAAFALWLEQGTAELFYGDRSHPPHCLHPRGGGGQRDPLASG
ncbi:MAG: polyprenyl synthetase family protein, partial [Bryobacterales bacterium]|nr:polyprenyl synthetase family protein [Bryobacteraceae bacterium]MDW8130610.1 polyprenyl synthetase family protein [Bryobacterales bacterium]